MTMHTSIKDQLQAAVASGAINVRATAKATPATSSMPKWVVVARKDLLAARNSAEALAHMKGIRDPEFAVRLNAILGTVQGIQARCVAESRSVVSARAATRKAESNTDAEPTSGDNKAPRLLAARRAAETAVNYVHSIAEGLTSRDIQPENFAEVSNTLRGYLKTVHVSLGELGQRKAVSSSHSMLENSSLNHYRHAQIKLERHANQNTDKPAFTVNLPVLAVFDGVVPVQRLVDAGLPVESMGGYPVFLHQTLLCLRTKMLDAQNFNKEQYLAGLLRQINERSGSSDNFELVTENGIANAQHEVYMYWLLPARQLTDMLKTANSALREWGLPFAGKNS